MGFPEDAHAIGFRGILVSLWSLFYFTFPETKISELA
jgi:hypothetical protein